MEEFKLKFITNQFLAEVLLFDLQTIGFPRKQYIEFTDQDYSMLKNADSFVFHILEFVKPLREMEEEAIDTKWQTLVTEVAYRAFYAKLFKENQKRIKDQLDRALEFKKLDICLRELRILELLELEIELLQRVLRIQPVKFVINTLYFLASQLYPSLGEIQKCIIVSEIMNAIGLYANKPYQTLEEANLKAEENALAPSAGSKLNEYNTDGGKNIYLRIKNDIDKKFILKPLIPSGGES